MEFFIPVFPKSILMILHKLLLFLIILSRSVQSISINGHRTALTATFSKFDLDIIPKPTVRFLISHIRQKALFDTNLTVPVLGESDGRISCNVCSKLMVEIRKLPRRGAFYSSHYIYYIYNIMARIERAALRQFVNFDHLFQTDITEDPTVGFS